MATFVAYIVCTITGLILMKFSREGILINLEDGSFNLHINVTMFLALIMYGASFLLWTGIVTKNDLSFIMPFSTAIVNVLSVTAGVLLFSENLSLMKTFGIILAIAGVVIMTMK